ncbi:MAG TPA: type VI secretion system baseplate subunit TssE [Thermoanaerobaculia bacterium]|nr:type VI secretion system baseplate subunit TssE [Thermoanaerobaculia bacterium]
MSESTTSVRMPLFDRLTDDETWVSWEPRPRRTLDRAGLRQSVRRELEQLFNTRSPLPVHYLAPSDRTVLDYGIPDLSEYSPRNPDDRTLLAETLRRAVVAFEPRLGEVRVRVSEQLGTARTLVAQLEAVLVTEDVREAVSFELLLGLNDGKVLVDAGS